jgi:hypothetical protein
VRWLTPLRTPPNIAGLRVFGAIAQLGERLHGMQEVDGSIPSGSTKSPLFRCVERRARCVIREARVSEVVGSVRDVDYRGRWVNQNGSMLSIDEQIEGRITGRFVSRKGRAAKDVSYAVLGVVNGELASFVVSFDDGATNLASITSFMGRYAREADAERLHTVWILARQFEDAARTKPTQVWNTFITNSDVFEKLDD